jgi:dinuclear metal center YbgI/SA1388 family protein
MAHRNELVEFINSELDVSHFEDASLNGLQIEGRDQVLKVVSAVDCCLESVERAIQLKADLLLVHHGIFWGKPLAICDAHKKLVSACIAGDLNVVAAHLPLDAHPTWGNKVLIAEAVGLRELNFALTYGGRPIGCVGLAGPDLSLDLIVQRIQQTSGVTHTPLVLRFGPNPPRKIAVVSGAAADALHAAKLEGFDTLITGEPRHSAYHYAKENNLNAIFAGHYATEVYGVQALGAELARRFQIVHEFVDIPTGI